jgi:hypothetical protein
MTRTLFTNIGLLVTTIRAKLCALAERKLPRGNRERRHDRGQRTVAWVGRGVDAETGGVLH